MATTVTARLANPNHPNGQRVLGGVTWTRKWHTASIADADAAIITALAAAEPALFETDATDVVAIAVTGHFQATNTHLGVLAEGVEIGMADAAAVVAATAAVERLAE